MVQWQDCQPNWNVLPDGSKMKKPEDLITLIAQDAVKVSETSFD
jgi:hypothetical protein